MKARWKAHYLSPDQGGREMKARWQSSEIGRGVAQAGRPLQDMVARDKCRVAKAG